MLLFTTLTARCVVAGWVFTLPLCAKSHSGTTLTTSSAPSSLTRPCTCCSEPERWTRGLMTDGSPLESLRRTARCKLIWVIVFRLSCGGRCLETSRAKASGLDRKTENWSSFSRRQRSSSKLDQSKHL